MESPTFWDGGKRVPRREALGAARQGTDEAALHGPRVGRGVRGLQAHHAQGSPVALGDGRAAALDAGAGRRLLDAAGREAALWLAAESLTLEHAGEPLSRYEVRVQPDTGKLRSVSRPRLFGTSAAVAKLTHKPWALSASW